MYILLLITLFLIKKELKFFFFFFISLNLFYNYQLNTNTINVENIYLYLKNLNIKLTNGVFFIHPWFLYISYSYMGYIFIRKSINFNIFFKKVKLMFNFSKKILKININFLSISILLGAYWAQQELD